MSGAPQRAIVTGSSRLRFAPHVKFRYDETRGRWVVLAPERLLLPDEQAVEILKLIDGASSVDAVIDDLTRRFEAPREIIAADVIGMLQDLADKGVLAS
ncbi:MAG TPA: pyrroloquinoline quinone biosynthesis peptide chaperone PqqD [Stellaceae bacterium]|nr:pyrroloquinoline quinone biosynthesis peptide chaperone PqqD [Stellaceae bacterium]